MTWRVVKIISCQGKSKSRGTESSEGIVFVLKLTSSQYVFSDDFPAAQDRHPKVDGHKFILIFLDSKSQGLKVDAFREHSSNVMQRNLGKMGSFLILSSFYEQFEGCGFKCWLDSETCATPPISLSMKNEKFIVNHLFDKGLRSFRAYFLESVGELQGTGVWA